MRPRAASGLEGKSLASSYPQAQLSPTFRQGSQVEQGKSEVHLLPPTLTSLSPQEAVPVHTPTLLGRGLLAVDGRVGFLSRIVYAKADERDHTKS